MNGPKRGAGHQTKPNQTKPNHKPGTVCWDYRTAVKARLAAKKVGPGSRLRRNIEFFTKDRIAWEWWVERVWEWDGDGFVEITRNASKGLP